MKLASSSHESLPYSGLCSVAAHKPVQTGTVHRSEKVVEDGVLTTANIRNVPLEIAVCFILALVGMAIFACRLRNLCGYRPGDRLPTHIKRAHSLKTFV